MRKTIAIFVVLVIAVLGFLMVKEQTTPSDLPGVDGKETQAVLNLNQEYEVKDHTLSVWAVTEDSRCASDVQCIQAGRVKVALTVVSPSGTSTTEMEPGNLYTTETIAITLDKVEPYPISTHKITDSEYRFHFTIADHQSGF